jgi:ABC-type metal ion transport system substrate-binding protein
LRDLGPGDKIVLPKDPIDGPRALILLHNYGLIAIDDTPGLNAKPANITWNPRELSFVQVDPAKIAESFEQAAAVALTYPIAEKAGLAPARDAMAMEDSRVPYAHVLVVRSADTSQAWVTKLIKAYHSEPVKNFILTRFKDSVRRPW